MNNIDKAKLIVIGLAGGMLFQMAMKKDIDTDSCILICRKILEILEDRKRIEQTRKIFN